MSNSTFDGGFERKNTYSTKQHHLQILKSLIKFPCRNMCLIWSTSDI